MISIEEFNQVIKYMNSKEGFEFWNIKTNVYSILRIFNSNFKNYKELLKNEKQIIVYVEEIDESYQLVILDEGKKYNLTPRSNGINDFTTVKRNTMVQYLKVLISFSTITPNKRIVNDESFFKTGYLLKDIIIDEKEWNFKIKTLFNNLIFNARENYNFSKELFYGIIISFMLENKDEFEYVENIKVKKNGNIKKTYEVKEFIDILNDSGYNDFNELVGSFDYSDIKSVIIILEKIGFDMSNFIFEDNQIYF